MAKKLKATGTDEGGAAVADTPAETGAAVQTPAQDLTKERYEPLLPIETLVPSPSNPRKHFDAAAITSLANDFKQRGQIQPILARPHPGKFTLKKPVYEIVVGERRWRAAQEAGLATLKAEIRELSDVDVLKLQLAENAERQDITPLEEAAAWKELMDKAGWDAHQLAADQDVSIRTVYLRLALLKMPKELTDALKDGKITTAHAEIIMSLPDFVRSKALGMALLVQHDWQTDSDVTRTMSIRDFREYIKREFLHEMSTAPWLEIENRRNESICKGCDTCALCPKRTGFNPDLLTKDEPDACQDGKCFANKMKAYVGVRQKELKQVEGECVKVSSHYYDKDGALGSNSYERSKSKTGTTPAIVVDGPDAGKEIRVKIAEHAKPKAPTTEKEKQEVEREKAKLEKEAEKRKFEEALQNRLYLALIANTKKVERGLLQRALAGVFSDLEYNVQLESDDERTWMSLLDVKTIGLSEKDVVGLSDQHFARAVAAVAFLPDYDFSIKEISAAAKAQGIDVKAVEEKLKADMAGVSLPKPDSSSGAEPVGETKGCKRNLETGEIAPLAGGKIPAGWERGYIDSEGTFFPGMPKGKVSALDIKKRIAASKKPKSKSKTKTKAKKKK